ncbi:ATP-binding cassette domain-containing protein [bacterium]|nr:ATP-binding cassette domain-containing protein [bacterium]
MTGRPLLEVRDAAWGYRLAGGWFTPAVPVSFTVSSGEIVLLSGDNGSGKTTILRGILGLVDQRAGEVAWGIESSGMGYVPQESVIDRSAPATALDVVRSGHPHRWGRGLDGARSALSMVGLEGKEDVLYGSLSGGQRQRVLMARALVGDPRLLILDEPTVNVDAGTAGQVGRLLQDLAATGLGMVITSHVRDWIRAAREVRVTAAGEAVHE